MKIISFNIKIDLDNAKKVVEYLEAQNADIICLQEVIRPLDDKVFSVFRSEEIIKNYLKKDYPYYFFAPEWVANKHIFENRDVNFGGMVEQGKLILSKYPIKHGYNYFYNKNYEFDCDRKEFFKGDDHGRTLQICDIEVNGKLIQVANVHGLYSSDKLDTKKTLLQSEFILGKLKERKIPTILIGDFNLLPNSESIKILNKEYKNLNNSFNITSTRPKDQIVDYVFIDANFSANSLVVDKLDISDHYPLIVELEFSE